MNKQYMANISKYPHIYNKGQKVAKVNSKMKYSTLLYSFFTNTALEIEDEASGDQG